MGTILAIVILGGLIAFSTTNVIALVRAYRERKKAKSEKKGEE